jgi:methyl coenzyme M reductase subunit D
MDYELEKESRVKMHDRRRKMDVMGTAMDMAVKDIKILVGMYSDNEEQAE